MGFVFTAAFAGLGLGLVGRDLAGVGFLGGGWTESESVSESDDDELSLCFAAAEPGLLTGPVPVLTFFCGLEFCAGLFEESSSLLSLESEDVSCGFLAMGFPLRVVEEGCCLLLDFSGCLVTEATGVCLTVSVCRSPACSSFLFLFLLFFFFLTFSVTPCWVAWLSSVDFLFFKALMMDCSPCTSCSSVSLLLFLTLLDLDVSDSVPF